MVALQAWYLLVLIQLLGLSVSEHPVAQCARLLNANATNIETVGRLCQTPSVGTCVAILQGYALSTDDATAICRQNPKSGICMADMLTAGFSRSQAENDCQSPAYGHCLATLSYNAYTGLKAKRICDNNPASGSCISLLLNQAWPSFLAEDMCQNPATGPCAAQMSAAGYGRSYTENLCRQNQEGGLCMAALATTAYSTSEREKICGI